MRVLRILSSAAILCIFSVCTYAQSPAAIAVSGTNMSDGTYLLYGELSPGCDCYEKDDGTRKITSTTGWWFSEEGGDCTSQGTNSEFLSMTMGPDCGGNILTYTSFFKAGVNVVAITLVPTLSQWGLIILALLLLISGALALRRDAVMA